MSVMNNTSLAGTTIFAFEIEPMALKKNYRYQHFFKTSLCERRPSDTSKYGIQQDLPKKRQRISNS